MRLDDLNALDADAAARELLRCCGSSRWAQRMTASRPFASVETMVAVADKCWAALDAADWLEAFAAHPRIGAGGAGRAGRAGRAGAAGGASGDWAAQEQAGVADAADGILRKLADANRDYEARFGYIFIVCATGKSAAKMLDMLEGRIGNDPDAEIHIAAGEQQKITRLRLMKLVEGTQGTSQ
jgi:2-oxo-4-hydroxy-4-carboxy-5-ureidoimidazoline decarboxylase